MSRSKRRVKSRERIKGKAREGDNLGRKNSRGSCL